MEETSPSQIDRLIGSTGLGILALAAEGDAYAIPLYYGRDDDRFYFHSRPGINDDFIERTKQACLVVTAVQSPDRWKSVQVFGHIERLAGPKARSAASQVLKEVPFPPEWQFEGMETPSRSGRGELDLVLCGGEDRRPQEQAVLRLI
jgi:nitroimidazol reductase NimA-like FMN-containing flavoprotein (pyridoxamine 5'-phosphate oxidase superfamily)